MIHIYIREISYVNLNQQLGQLFAIFLCMALESQIHEDLRKGCMIFVKGKLKTDSEHKQWSINCY
jgi:hypothetical protein